MQRYVCTISARFNSPTSYVNPAHANVRLSFDDFKGSEFSVCFQPDKSLKLLPENVIGNQVLKYKVACETFGASAFRKVCRDAVKDALAFPDKTILFDLWEVDGKYVLRAVDKENCHKLNVTLTPSHKVTMHNDGNGVDYAVSYVEIDVEDSTRNISAHFNMPIMHAVDAKKGLVLGDSTMLSGRCSHCLQTGNEYLKVCSSSLALGLNYSALAAMAYEALDARMALWCTYLAFYDIKTIARKNEDATFQRYLDWLKYRKAA